MVIADQLFVYLDQSDFDLRHSLANLMAVILGSPSRSNHLWFHMFAADRLQNSYMTGFMVSTPFTITYIMCLWLFYPLPLYPLF